MTNDHTLTDEQTYLYKYRGGAHPIKRKYRTKQAGMSSAQPQAEAVSLKFWLVCV